MYAKTTLMALLFAGAIAGTSCQKVQADTIDSPLQYQQLKATSTNLEQQIVSMNKASMTSTGQAKLASLKVQKANVDSQITVIDTQRDEAQQKAKADADAKTKAEADAKAKSDAAAASAQSQASSSSSEPSSQQTSIQSTAYSPVSITSASRASSTSNGGSSDRQKLVDYAKQFIGVPYVWGGTTPSGFDCSGLTSYVYSHTMGINIGRTTYSQNDSGKHVSLSDLQPGDLILENSGEHVAMYIGNGQQIAAPEPGKTVTIEPIRGAMYGLRYLQ